MPAHDQPIGAVPCVRPFPPAPGQAAGPQQLLWDVADLFAWLLAVDEDDDSDAHGR